MPRLPRGEFGVGEQGTLAKLLAASRTVLENLAVVEAGFSPASNALT